MESVKKSFEDEYQEWLKEPITLEYELHLDDIPYGEVYDFSWYELPYRKTTSVDIDWEYDITVRDALEILQDYFPDEVYDRPEIEIHKWQKEHFDEYYDKYEEEIMAKYEDWAEEDAREKYDYDEAHSEI